MTVPALPNDSVFKDACDLRTGVELALKYAYASQNHSIPDQNSKMFVEQSPRELPLRLCKSHCPIRLNRSVWLKKTLTVENVKNAPNPGF